MTEPQGLEPQCLLLGHLTLAKAMKKRWPSARGVSETAQGVLDLLHVRFLLEHFGSSLLLYLASEQAATVSARSSD